MWQEYFKELLNGDIQEEEELYYNVQPSISELTIQEIETVIKELINNKAPGLDGITMEILKAGGHKLAKEILKLTLKIWRKEAKPKEWKEAIVLYTTTNKKACAVAVYLRQVRGNELNQLMFKNK